MKLEVVHGKYGYNKDRIIHDDISFCVNPGELMTILGPNGVGKTTLLRCITHLLKWQRGETLIDNVPINDNNQTQIWKRIGYVPQSNGSKFSYSIMDMVLMGRSSHLKVYSTPNKKDYEIAMHALEQVGIAHLRNKMCTEISGGEYQLVLIARALATKPELLILDEPESHLDFRNQMLVLSMLEKVVREEKLSCIINTHYPEHAIRLADTALMLGRGKPYLFGSAKEIITTENLSEYFGVMVKLIKYEHKDKTLCSIIPLELTKSE